MFPLLCISLQILMIIVLLDAFDKYKKNQASIYFFKCILGIVLLPILIIIPMFLNTLDISSDFIHTDIGQSIVIIIMGMSVFMCSYPCRKYMKYLNSETVDRLPEKDKQIYPFKMFIDRGASLWIIGAIWMLVGAGTLSRDTSNALNELGRIFDKKKIEEQQELAAVFGEEAYRLAHNMKDDGSGRKILVHAAIGGIMSSITGAGFTSGAVGAGLNEAVIKEIDKIAKHDPGAAQIVSAIVGAAAAKAAGGNAAAGASAAASGTKWNYLLVNQYNRMRRELAAAKTEEEKAAVIAFWTKIYDKQRAELKQDIENFPFDGSKITRLWYEYKFLRKYRNPLYELDGTASFILPPTLSTGSKNDDPVLGKEVLQNIVSGTESLKYGYLGDHGNIPSTAQTGFRWLGRVGGVSGSIFSITDFHEDYQKYSGGDLAIAWGTNMISIGAGLLGASLGATGGAYVGGIVGGGTGALTGGTAGTVLGPEGTIVGGGVGGIVGGFTGVGVGAFLPESVLERLLAVMPVELREELPERILRTIYEKIYIL